MSIRMQYRQNLEFVPRNNLQFTRSPKPSCFPRFCQKTRYSPPKPCSQITLILLKWRRAIEGNSICNFVLGSCVPPVRVSLSSWKREAWGESSDWSKTFPPVLKSVILRCEALERSEVPDRWDQLPVWSLRKKRTRCLFQGELPFQLCLGCGL